MIEKYEYYILSPEKEGHLRFLTTEIDLEHIMLSEIKSDRKTKQKYCIMSLTCRIHNSQIVKTV